MTGWRRSSYSGTQDESECVEVARMGRAIGVRDSKNPGGPVLALSHRAFRALLDQLKAGIGAHD
jgi:hypothetical protein